MVYQPAEKVRDRISFKRLLKSGIRNDSTMLEYTFNAGFISVGKTYLNHGTYEGLKNLIHFGIFENIRTHNTDQVVLNLFFDGKVILLPAEYNLIISKWPFMAAMNRVDPGKIKILHYTGLHKPWEPGLKMNEQATNPDSGSFYQKWQAEFLEITLLSGRTRSR